eukprot:scaffold152763_cov26-Tisochrysis_lutea.AAC.2
MQTRGKAAITSCRTSINGRIGFAACQKRTQERRRAPVVVLKMQNEKGMRADHLGNAQAAAQAAKPLQW